MTSRPGNPSDRGHSETPGSLAGELAGTSPTFYALEAHNRREEQVTLAGAALSRGLPTVVIGLWLVTDSNVPLAGLAIALIGLAIGVIGFFLGHRRPPDAGSILTALGVRDATSGEAALFADLVAEAAAAAGIATPGIAVVSVAGIGVWAAGEKGKSGVKVIATSDTFALPRDQFAGAVARAVGLMATGGWRRADQIARTSVTFDPGHTFRRLLKVSLGLALVLWAIFAAVSIATHGLTDVPTIILGLIVTLITVTILVSITGAYWIFGGWVAIKVVRALLVRAFGVESDELADAVAVELGRNPQALEELLTDLAEGRRILAPVPVGILAYMGLAAAFDPVSLARRANALRNLRALPPHEFALTASSTPSGPGFAGAPATTGLPTWLPKIGILSHPPLLDTDDLPDDLAPAFAQWRQATFWAALRHQPAPELTPAVIAAVGAMVAGARAAGRVLPAQLEVPVTANTVAWLMTTHEGRACFGGVKAVRRS